MKNKKSRLIISVAFLVVAFVNHGNAQRISAGSNHSVALCGDSNANAWGNNYSGQLGDGSTGTSSSSPVHVQSLSSIIAVAGGGSFSVALQDNGNVWAFGNNDSGAVGDSTSTSRFSPVQVHGAGNIGFLTGITAIAASHGHGHGMALKNDSTLYAWGFNYYGECGDSTRNSKWTPVQVHGKDNLGFLKDISAIAAGSGYSLVLKHDGTVWSWGNNSSCELGDSTYNRRYNPVKVYGLTDIIAIAAGTAHSLALKNDGTVWAWGYNTNGQLGDSTNNIGCIPVKVKGLTDIIAVAAGQAHSLALKNDGTVWAWGYNTNGQLGNGTNVERWTPVEVSGLTDVIAISASSHSLALKNDSTVWAWGLNNNGQIGDGTTINRWAPVQISGLCDPNAGVKELSGNSTEITIYPNPFSDNITFQLPETLADINLSLYDVYSRLVSTTNASNTNKITLQNNNLPKGIYFYRLTSKNNVVKMGKVVKN